MTQKVPKLKDIAQKAGVSLATTSLILRDEGNALKFKSETRKRVQDIANELGWRQNLLVKSIQTGKSKTIGVLVPPYDSFWSNVLVGIHRGLAGQDYMPITLWRADQVSEDDFLPNDADGVFGKSDEGMNLINRLMDRRVEGVIVWPTMAERYHKCLDDLANRGIPVVLVDHEYSDQSRMGSVITDEECGSRLAAGHLLGLGHRNIAFLTEAPLKTRTWQVLREKYFQEAILECPDATYSKWELNRADQDAVKVAKELLGSPERPTAVFCSTDHEAQDLYWAALEMGIRIPEDISVVGYSDLQFAATMRPPLTTVHQRPREIGEKAAALVIDGLNSPDATEAVNAKIACELIVRGSTLPHGV